MICKIYRLARSAVYAAAPAATSGKRGPRTAVSDAEVVEEIRTVLAACPFRGEGYRKVRARLAHRGYATSGKRVLRLMRAHGLLAPRRLGPPNGNPAHDGTIMRQGVRHAFGRFGKEVARGLAIRCDWGPQHIADAWINEVKWLGCTISPSYVGEPECNGVAERFKRTLKEQSFYLHQIQNLEEARRIIGEFMARYNAEWLIEQLRHRMPAQARADAQRRAA